MATDLGAEGEAIGLAPAVRREEAGPLMRRPVVLRLISIALFA